MPQLDFNLLFSNFLLIFLFFIFFYLFLYFFFLRRIFSILLLRNYVGEILKARSNSMLELKTAVVFLYKESLEYSINLGNFV